VPILAPIAFLVILTLGLSAFAGPVSGVTRRAADQLFDRDAYVRAVLGEGGLRAAR
jgi:multicomponent Na+:H+ antiporter subunit D